jgi:hypothetical protein
VSCKQDGFILLVRDLIRAQQAKRHCIADFAAATAAATAAICAATTRCRYRGRKCIRFLGLASKRKLLLRTELGVESLNIDIQRLNDLETMEGRERKVKVGV